MNVEITAFIADVINNRQNYGWIVIDADFIIHYVNNAFCRWVENQKYNILGHSLSDAFYQGKKPFYRGKDLSYQGKHNFPLIETLEVNKELARVECYIPIFVKDNWCLVNTYLKRDQSGKPQYVAACYTPINHYKAFEEALEHIGVDIIRSFAKAIDARDTYTGKHSEHVANLMMEFAEFLGLPRTQVNLAYLSGVVHDIGKIGVPEDVLNKPAKLSKEEFTFIRRHPDIGANILAEISGFEKIAEAVRYHHERYDGMGYPEGVRGEDIPKFSRMLALCDSYDAMTSVRCYRKPFTINQALEEIKRGAGLQFDPVLSKKFIDLFQKDLFGVNK
ncbi:HD-GYP domain-containing protein [Sporomusa acidovorans]|uniref:Cyclic di-GMP phosphodiesterase response regulator RpfG n=1 Tax=Sporomusa acidovorans (strain ATCC 49682 / DSM 3132 / Mol) TaxID=1123286 RepID=A0ABZ3J3B0_SPOA4|nr:HD-GYP domain-containing protein [Sporomusa acidovorans]OZC20036.1 cyclic di-GMP phosphodiesterase response regulator RpfG [Sporomusa acidovorans DSM 3132]SDD46919.1 HDIG domain-containing protein [Sporomusa acidovorans]